MTFFDKKEEVIQIELTQYGKYLLSLGKWKPVYYAFYDDDILYDGACAGITETQNDIETRIQEGTPQLKTQYAFVGRESDFLNTYFKQYFKSDELTRIKMESPIQREFALQESLGTADNLTQIAPRWQLAFLEGELTGSTSTNFLSGKYQMLRIPQLECNITYNTEIRTIENTPGGINSFDNPDTIPSDIFSDGSYVSVQTDPFILLVKEENTVFEKENFDIEVYKSCSSGYEPLLFRKKPQQIVDNLLTFPEPINITLDPTFVEYYFNIYVDSEINKGDLCRAITQLKAQDIYVDVAIECPEEGSILTINPYTKAAPESSGCKDENTGAPSYIDPAYPVEGGTRGDDEL